MAAEHPENFSFPDGGNFSKRLRLCYTLSTLCLLAEKVSVYICIYKICSVAKKSSSYSKIVIQPWQSEAAFFRQMICRSGIKAEIRRETCAGVLFVRKSCFMRHCRTICGVNAKEQIAFKQAESAESTSHPQILNLAENIPEFYWVAALRVKMALGFST